MRRWTASPSLVLLHEDEEFLPLLAEVLRRSSVCGGRVHDARIAALSLRYGVRFLLSADRDFSRFPQDQDEESPRVKSGDGG